MPGVKSPRYDIRMKVPVGLFMLMIGATGKVAFTELSLSQNAVASYRVKGAMTPAFVFLTNPVVPVAVRVEVLQVPTPA